MSDLKDEMISIAVDFLRSFAGSLGKKCPDQYDQIADRLCERELGEYGTCENCWKVFLEKRAEYNMREQEDIDE